MQGKNRFDNAESTQTPRLPEFKHHVCLKVAHSSKYGF
jgi:hypothetical protein